MKSPGFLSNRIPINIMAERMLRKTRQTYLLKIKRQEKETGRKTKRRKRKKD